jgi:Tol biopolymer transport system component
MMQRPMRKTAIFAILLVVLGLCAGLSTLSSSRSIQASRLDSATPAVLPIGGGNGKIAFLGSPRDAQGYAVCVVDVDGSNERCLTDFADGIGQNWIQWHPDGKHILAQAQAGIDYFIDSISGERVELAQFRNFETLILSPDAKQVAYAKAEDQGTGIFVVDFDGKNQRKVTSVPFKDILPVWSPDGQKLTFVGDTGQEEDIFAVNLYGSDLVNLTQNVLEANPPVAISSLKWSPDGKQIAFTALDTQSSETKLYVMNADGSKRFSIFRNTTYDDMTFKWRPDSKKFLFGMPSGAKFIADRDGSNASLMPGARYCFESPSWSPDGLFILCTVIDHDTNAYNLYQINATTGDAKRLTLSDKYDALIGIWGPAPLNATGFAATLTAIAPSRTPSPASSQTAIAQTATGMQREINTTRIAGTVAARSQTPPSSAQATVFAWATQIIQTVTAAAGTQGP